MSTRIEEKTSIKADQEICCPPFEVAKWNNVIHSWDRKLFLKDSVPELFHVPLPGTYRRAVTRMWKRASQAGAAPAASDFLLLAHDPSAFKGELYMLVTHDIPNAPVMKLSGKFFSQVFDAGYGEVPRCLTETTSYMLAHGMKPKKDYIYFPYCPKCSQKYGASYVVIVSQFE